MRYSKTSRRKLADVVHAEQPKIILKIGVSTGLMLHRYPVLARIFGFDLSDDMVAIARKRAAALDSRVIALLRMNAERVAFADDSFDCVVMAFTLSVKPRPRRCIAESRPVCCKDSTILVLSHFSGSRARRCMERVMRSLSYRTSVRSDFDYEEQIMRHDWQIESAMQANMLGLSKLVKIRNR